MPPPDRWENYCPLGKQIPSTPFIAFKVPLKEDLMVTIEEKDRFSPAILIKTLEEKGHKLGGIIDLTFTLKYYNKEEFEKNSIKHWKIFTKGHEVPSENVFQKFAKAVKTVENDGTLIGVHCTHGVNRTGYLICRYMIEEMNIAPDEAIAMFNEARGHNLERENYLQDLKLRKRGESTYDPDFKDDKCTYTYDNYNFRRKDRWRKNREHHPDWRRQDRGFSRTYPQSFYADRSQYFTTNTHYNQYNDNNKTYRNNHSMDCNSRNKHWRANGFGREQETFFYSNSDGWKRNLSYHRNSEEMVKSAEGSTAHDHSTQYRHSHQHVPTDDHFSRVPHSSQQIHKSSEVKPTYDDNSRFKDMPEDSSSFGRNKRKWGQGATKTFQSVFK